MDRVLYRLGRGAARRHWLVIAVWVVLLAGLLIGRDWVGGTFSDDLSVPGTTSQRGQDVLQEGFPSQVGYTGQVVFAAGSGDEVKAHSSAVDRAVANVGKLGHVTEAVSPFASPASSQVSQDGQIAYATVQFDVAPETLSGGYQDRLDAAVQPARDAGLRVELGGSAGQVAGRATCGRKRWGSAWRSCCCCSCSPCWLPRCFHWCRRRSAC